MRKFSNIIIVAGVIAGGVVAASLSATHAFAQGVKEQRHVAPKELMPPMTDEVPAPPIAEEPPLIEKEAVAGKAPAKEGAAEETQESESAPAAVEVQADAEEPEQAPVTVPVDPAIEVVPASNISLDTLGTLDAKKGGFPVDVWEKSEQPRITALLDQLPSRIESQVLRDALRRLLLSSTRSPKSENIRQNVFDARIHALLAMGEVAGATNLLDMVPEDQKSGTIRQQQFLAHAYTGDEGWICERIADARKQYQGSFWEKADLYCQARAGQREAVLVGLDVLQEQQKPVPQAFRSLLEVMLGDAETPSEHFEASTPPEEAIWYALAGVDAFPEDYLSQAPLVMVQRVAANTKFLDYVREAAASRMHELHVAEVERTAAETQLEAWALKQFSTTASKKPSWPELVKELATKTAVKAGDAASEALQVRREFRLAAMLQAFAFEPQGVTLEAANENITAEAGMVSPLMVTELDQAVRLGHKGEVLLLAILAVGQLPLGTISESGLAHVVHSLERVGFGQEARALAAEALVATQLSNAE